MCITQNPVGRFGWKFQHKSIPIKWLGFCVFFWRFHHLRRRNLHRNEEKQWKNDINVYYSKPCGQIWLKISPQVHTNIEVGFLCIFFWRCLCFFRRNRRRNEEKTVKNWHKCVLLETLWTELAENFNTIPYRYCLGFCVFFPEVPPSLPAEPPPKWWKTVKNGHNGVLLQPCGQIWLKISTQVHTNIVVGYLCIFLAVPPSLPEESPPKWGKNSEKLTNWLKISTQCHTNSAWVFVYFFPAEPPPKWWKTVKNIFVDSNGPGVPSLRGTLYSLQICIFVDSNGPRCPELARDPI